MRPWKVILPFQIPFREQKGRDPALMSPSRHGEHLAGSSLAPAGLPGAPKPRAQSDSLAWDQRLWPLVRQSLPQGRGEGAHPKSGQSDPPQPSSGSAGQKPPPDVAQRMPRGTSGTREFFSAKANRARRAPIESPASPEVRKRRKRRVRRAPCWPWSRVSPSGTRCPREERAK